MKMSLQHGPPLPSILPSPPRSTPNPPPGLPTYSPKPGRHTKERAQTHRASLQHAPRHGGASFGSTSSCLQVRQPGDEMNDFGATVNTMTSISTGLTRDPLPQREDCSYLFDTVGHGVLPKKVQGIRVMDLSQEDIKASRQAMREVVGTTVCPESLGLTIDGRLRPTSISAEFHVSKHSAGEGLRKTKDNMPSHSFPKALPMGRVDTLKLWESFKGMIKKKKVDSFYMTCHTSS